MKKIVLTTVLIPVAFFLSGFCVDKFFEPYFGSLVFGFLYAYVLRNEDKQVACILTLIMSFGLYGLANVFDTIGWDFFISRTDWSNSSFSPNVTEMSWSFKGQCFISLFMTGFAAYMNKE